MPAFSLFTDNHVRGPLIKALRQRGRRVDRAVDIFGQENDDDELFAHAAKEEHVFLTCDEGIQAIAHDWLRRGRTDFRMIYCTMEHQQVMTIGELLEAIEDILRKPDAFAYRIEYIKRGPERADWPPTTTTIGWIPRAPRADDAAGHLCRLGPFLLAAFSPGSPSLPSVQRVSPRGLRSPSTSLGL